MDIADASLPQMQVAASSDSSRKIYPMVNFKDSKLMAAAWMKVSPKELKRKKNAESIHTCTDH